MRSLIDFEVPKRGEVTLCEIDGRVISSCYDFPNINIFTTALEHHPSVYVSQDILYPIKSKEDISSVFIPVKSSLLKHLTQVYCNNGFFEVLRELSKQHKGILGKTSQTILRFISTVQNLKEFVYKPIAEKGLSVTANFVLVKNWPAGMIRCFDWHPNLTKIAVVTCDDYLRIYSKHSNYVPLLKCKQQKNVTCIAWRPMSESEIAVACENYIILWNSDSNSVVTRSSGNNATILSRVKHRPIVCLSWNYLGSILSSVATQDASIYMWDVELDTVSQLKRSGNSGNVLVKWSPGGDKMFSATTSIIFRVWDTRTWQMEKWSILSGHVQAACWSPCGTALLFTTSQECVIYGLSFGKCSTAFASDSLNSPKTAVPLFDTTMVDIDGCVIGGLVKDIQWDISGLHVAVLFKDSNYVAVFIAITTPTLQLNPGCLVSGTREEVPCAISFQKNFDKGTCLTIAWSSGRMQYFPLIYSDGTLLQALKNTFHNRYLNP